MSGAGDLPDRNRLLRHLAAADAFAKASPLGCGRLALFRSANGTSLGAGYAPMALADTLVAEGLASWSGTGRTRRLVVARAAARADALAQASVTLDGVATPVMLDERESPLLWLHRRLGKDGQPQISATELAAGERFRADLTLAQMLPRTTMNWDAAFAPNERGASRGPAQASDSALAARQCVRRACDRLGPELTGIVIDVCGFLKGLDRTERERGWPSRSAKVVLRLALASLGRHYGIELGGTPRPGRAAVWRDADARPTL